MRRSVDELRVPETPGTSGSVAPEDGPAVPTAAVEGVERLVRAAVLSSATMTC